jgi:hypothetical protein
MNDPISDALNIISIKDTKDSIIVRSPTTVTTDFEYARGNLIAAIEKGQEALTDVVDIASQTQRASSFEAVSSLLNSVVAANKELLELSKKKKDLEKDDSNPSTVNNNLFVGSTAELLKLIKDNDKK